MELVSGVLCCFVGSLLVSAVSWYFGCCWEGCGGLVLGVFVLVYEVFLGGGR
jgi:hypothetical protein